MRLYQHQRATNDSNGNPRRLYVVWQTKCEHGGRWGAIVAVHDEGYGGLPPGHRDMYDLGSVNISVGEYNTMIRHGKAAGILHNG